LASGVSSRVLRVAVLCVVALAAGAGLGAGTGEMKAQKNMDPLQQKNPTTQPGGSLPSDDIPSIPDSPVSAAMKEERVRAINDDRHKRLEDDVARLQSLTSELKADVDKSNKDELSLDVIRKAAEIEKLAHDVQSRMKN